MFDFISNIFNQDPLRDLHRLNEYETRAEMRNQKLQTKLEIEKLIQSKIKEKLEELAKAK